MSKRALRTIATLVLGVVSLAVLYLMCELRYVWYIDIATVVALRTGWTIGVVAITLCWVFLPSRILVGAIGALMLLLPQAIRFTDLPYNPGFLAFVALAISLLVATTHLRRGMRPLRTAEPDIRG